MKYCAPLGTGICLPYHVERMLKTVEGIYSIKAQNQSNQREFTDVAIVTSDDAVRGGDGNYFYRGSLEFNNNVITAHVEVKLYQGLNNGIFPGLNEFSVTLTGSPSPASGGVLVFTGAVDQFPEMKVAVFCKKLSDF